MTSLDQAAIERVSGPTWAALKAQVLAVAEVLLSVSKSARSYLTTIYVKFERPDGSVYAVMWIRKAGEGIVTGLALPQETAHPRLHDAPKGKTYPGLTRYLTVQEGDEIPPELTTWARTAFAAAKATQRRPARNE